MAKFDPARDAKILVLNIGATSTKVAFFTGKECAVEEGIAFHPAEPYKRLADEVPERTAAVRAFIEVNAVDLAALDIVASRGGLLPPLPAGVTRVNAEMLGDLRAWIG